jgi:hypothetical protein
MGHEMIEKWALNALSDGREISYFFASVSKASPIFVRCAGAIGNPERIGQLCPILRPYTLEEKANF